MALFFKKVYQFYRYDCCWPYAASFFLALLIFWLDFFIVYTHYYWVSYATYGVLFTYYLYVLHIYFQGKIEKRDRGFFIRFLSAKIILWACILVFLYLTR